MKKRIRLLLTLIISMFIGVKGVAAAKELTCIYEGNERTFLGLCNDFRQMLVQNSNGEHFIYLNTKCKKDIDDPNWKNPSSDWGYNIDIEFDPNFYSSPTVLSSCPKWARGYNSSYKFTFSDVKVWNIDDYGLIKEFDGLPNLDVYRTFFRDKNSEYLIKANEIEKTEKYKKCVYSGDSSNVNLYFNEENYTFINESNLIYQSETKFSLKELLGAADASTTTNGCPLNLYRIIVSSADVNNMFADYYLHSDNSMGILELVLLKEDGEWEIKIPEPEIPIDNCEDLFGSELLEKINSIMDWIKILIPILLIAFGVIDFTKAIFASSEDNMKKAQKTFFNRIIAAILIFISPIFINLILSLANEVWGFISPDTCIR